MRFSELAGLKVAVLGCGRDAAAVVRHWPHADLPRPAVLAEKAPAAECNADFKGCDPVIAPFTARLLSEYDVLIKSPGISRAHPAVATALSAGVRLVTPVALALAERGTTRVVAVTGTKGKSTSASLLATILQTAGVDVALGGNIGIPALDLLPGRHAVWVVELSSYQLADLDERVEIGVILNLFPEHLDWHGSFPAYAQAKLRLASLADKVFAGTAVIREFALSGVVPLGDERSLHGSTVGIADGERLLLAADRLPLKGAHNRGNIAAMWQIARHLGIEDDTICAALKTFCPLAHRMQVLGTFRGLTWIDDSISTTPRATLAAIEAFAGPPLTVLIGGFDRGVDWRAALSELAALPIHAVIGVGDHGARLIAALDQGGRFAGGTHSVTDLRAAVETAAKVTPPGGVVLLSPGAPSYDQYFDFQARGAHFATLVAGLSELTE